MPLRSLLFIASLFTAFTVFTAHAEPQSPDEFIQIFQSENQAQQIQAAQALEWAGLSSPKIFDVVEADALKALPNDKDKFTVNYLSYMVKALAFSGNEKYRPTIEKIQREASNKKVKKYAQESLPKLAVYTRLNQLIVPKPWPENAYPSTNQRLINMLQSNETELLLLAAKRINYSNNYQAEVLSQLNKSLLENYQKPLSDDRLDAVAWLTHALAGSRSLDYKPTIETVANTAENKKLRKYAVKYLKYYNQ